MEHQPDGSNSPTWAIPKIINKKYIVSDKVGSGSFGEIYAGLDTRDSNFVAIKLEPVSTRTPQLMYEAKIYSQLSGGEGIPKLHWSGVEAGWNILVIEFLGSSLEDLLHKFNKCLPILYVLQLAQQMLNRIEYLHDKFLLHRDIKPENFLVGCESKETLLHLIDFGLAKKYRDSCGRHIPYRESKGMTGTARYASTYTHLGIEQSRRDDLEGMAYVLIYLVRGQLPWQGLKATAKEDKHGKILSKKLNISVEALCDGLPDVFRTFLTYCKVLKFQDRPDYSLFRKYFHEEWLRMSSNISRKVEWTSAAHRTDSRNLRSLEVKKKELEGINDKGGPRNTNLQTGKEKTENAASYPANGMAYPKTHYNHAPLNLVLSNTHCIGSMKRQYKAESVHVKRQYIGARKRKARAINQRSKAKQIVGR